MSKLTITGSKRYIEYMEKHLKEEHPKTKSHIKSRGGW